MSRRFAALLVASVLAAAAAACGSRTDEPSTIAAGGAPAAGGDGSGSGDFPRDPEAPCGPGEAAGATDTGVTDSEITIATIQDIGGPVPGLFQPNLDAMKAFVAYCNELGGINGRSLKLEALDSRLSEHRAATQEACSAGLAIVGQAVALDSGGANVGVNCEIPDIPAFTAETAHAGAVNMVQPLPNPPELLAVGPQRYLKEESGDAVESAAMFYINTPVTKVNADKRVAGYEDIGFEFEVETATAAPRELNWGPKVEELREAEASYVTMVADVDNMAGMLTEIQTQGLDPEIIDFDAEGYQQELIEQAGPAAEGVRLWIAITPFEEAEQNDEMQRYLHWLEETDAKAPASALGVQGWSAGLLFATAAKALGNDVTRQGLLDELHAITEWDGHGIHAPSNPGENVPSACFIYMTVEGEEFVREFPDEGFECADDNVVEVDYDHPPGAGT